MEVVEVALLQTVDCGFTHSLSPNGAGHKKCASDLIGLLVEMNMVGTGCHAHKWNALSLNKNNKYTMCPSARNETQWRLRE